MSVSRRIPGQDGERPELELECEVLDVLEAPVCPSARRM